MAYNSADRVKIDLSDGFSDIMKSAVDYNDIYALDNEDIMQRNNDIRRDLKYVQEDGTLSCFKSMIPKYIFMLLENYAILMRLANELNDELEEIKKEQKG